MIINLDIQTIVLDKRKSGITDVKFVIDSDEIQFV